MSPITLNTVSKHKGWRRTPLNHLIRPMRMRPLHPLPSLRTKQQPSKTKLKKKLDKRKFELTRARCTVIDPARYGAVHLKDGDGLLGADVVAFGTDEVEEKEPERPLKEVVVEQGSNEETSRSPTPAPVVSQPPPAPVLIQPQSTPNPPILQLSEKEDSLSLIQEKSSTLALLGGMFGEGEWGGRESVSGDEMEVMDMEGEGEAAYEVVPQVASGAGMVETEGEELGQEVDMDEAEEQEEDEESADENEDAEDQEDQEEQESPIKHSSLKDMFKPQEETGGFSLGLDIELDPDAESFLPSSISVPAPPTEPILAPASIQTEKHTHTIQFTPDSKAPFFFIGGKNDILRVIAEKGWEWPHPGTSEEIRAKWDKNKTELTREYTRRHREAVKRRRRGGGTKGDEA